MKYSELKSGKRFSPAGYKNHGVFRKLSVSQQFGFFGPISHCCYCGTPTNQANFFSALIVIGNGPVAHICESAEVEEA